MRKKITASIVTFNNSDEIRGVLNAIQQSRSEYEIETYVVDNNSADGTLDIVKNEYPNIRIIENKENLGYGAGHNRAIKIAESDYHFIINPDISFEASLLDDAAKYLDKHSDTVLISPSVYDMEGTRKHPPKRNPRIRYIIPRLISSKNKLFEKWRDEYTLRRVESKEPFDIEFCSGSFMICRTSALKKVGGFDERYFLYYEDADLSRMMAKEGKVECVPYLRVKHRGVRAAHHSSKARKLMIQSMIKYFNKWGWRL